MNQLYFAMATVQAFFSERLDNRKDRGATAVEYGLMVGLIAVVIIVGVTLLGTELRDMFQSIGNRIGAIPAAG